MPAPQASMMQQLARAKFTSFALKIPQNWKQPTDDQYNRAFKDGELVTAPGSPPLFIPATMNKYHTDAQKMHIAKVGGFIDGMCSAICSAWSQWQSTATMAGILVTGPAASLGQVVGVPWTPLIMASAPKSTPMEAIYSTVIAAVLDLSWTTYTATIKFAMSPIWPQFAAFALPVAPPQPGTPIPLASMVQLPLALMAQTMKMQMIGNLGNPKAPFHMELFDSICTAFQACHQTWLASTNFTNVLGLGGVPTWTPLTPAGPVVGTAMMPPGGIV